MEVVILGSGCAFPARVPAAVRNPSGCCVVLDRGGVIVFDLGFGNLRQMARAGLSPADVTDVFFTHRHPDHVGDLAALLFRARYEAGPRRGRLRLWGPRGFARHVERLRRAHSPWLEPRGYELLVSEVSPRRSVAGARWQARCHPVVHPTPAVAYRLSYKGKSFVYSGDTGFSPTLAHFASGCDLFLLECTLDERQPSVDHLNAPAALAIMGASRCKRGLLTHLSEASELALRRLLPQEGTVGLAEDLLRVSL